MPIQAIDEVINLVDNSTVIIGGLVGFRKTPKVTF